MCVHATFFREMPPGRRARGEKKFFFPRLLVFVRARGGLLPMPVFLRGGQTTRGVPEKFFARRLTRGRHGRPKRPNQKKKKKGGWKFRVPREK
jgi:hypothetical protein